MTVQTKPNTTIANHMQRRFAAFLAALIATFLPALAMAASPWAQGTSGLSEDTLLFLTPIAGIALMVLGCLAWFGKINWMWVIGFIVGVVLVFGHEQIIQWVRQLFNV